MKDKKVKIIATLGPATDSAEIIQELAEEGVDIFRINLSHANREEIRTRVSWVRAAEKKIKRPLTVMGDLAGPKIRIGDVEAGAELVRDEMVKIYKETVMGSSEGFSLNHSSIVTHLEPGAEIYIDDGYLKLRVETKTHDGVMARVIVGGELKPRKGFSAEGLALSTVGVSEKDRADIKTMLEEETDALAISFVQSDKDIFEVRELIPAHRKIMLVAKIETAMGIENAEKIIDAADALMVARGDMGLAVPIAEVPHIQKRLINLCLQKAKPVITATQMLESMIHHPIPTRAEVTDVANAILDGTDAVMLSAETASGKFPVETVRTMVKIIRSALPHVTPRYFHDEAFISNAVSESVSEIATQIKSSLVIVFTQSGMSARRVARNRHTQTIIALSPDKETIRTLNFTWGVHPKLIPATEDFDNLRMQAKEFAKENGVVDLEKGNPFVIVAGMPFGKTGSTNMLFVEKV
ncbi:pyruvate kinase [soil metagenome]